MNISRRGLLGMLAAGVGAAIVRPGLIMPIKPKLVVPDFRDFSTDNMIVKATEIYSGPVFAIIGKDAYGKEVVETIRLDEMGRTQFSMIRKIVSSPFLGSTDA